MQHCSLQLVFRGHNTLKSINHEKFTFSIIFEHSPDIHKLGGIQPEEGNS